MRTMQQQDAASWCFSRTGSTLAAKENHVMVRLNLSNYTVPYCYVPGVHVTRRLRKPTSWLASNKLCLKFNKSI